MYLKQLLFRRHVLRWLALSIFLVASVTLISLLASKLSQGKQKDEYYGEGVILSWPYPLTTEKENRITRPRTRESLRGKVPSEEKREKLREIFPLIDDDHDNLLLSEEISAWIAKQVKQHMQKGLRENVQVFTSIDNDPRNGVVSWDEYHTWFLKNHGKNETSWNEHSESHSELGRSLREKIAWDQAAWQEAARSDPKSLNLDEFLGFRHPESSHSNLLHRVEEMLGDYDNNFDDELNWEEFSALTNSLSLFPLSQFTNQGDFAMKQKNEFTSFVDRNRDGKIDQRELLSYINPSNARRSVFEADILVQLSDKNGDSRLDLNEVLTASDVFYASKVLDVEQKLHEEY